MENLVRNHIYTVLGIAGLVSIILTGCAIQLGDTLYKRFQRAAIAHQLGKIKMKSFGVLVLLLLGSCLARSAPITDVGLGTWRYDAQAHLVTVPVLNSSQKSLTAFNLTLKVTAGGTVSEYQSGRDFLSVALLQERFKDAPKEAFGTANIPPGGVYEEKLSVPADFENISVVLDMAAFSDKTAEATNVPALERLVQKRKAIAASIEKASGVIAASAPETAADAVHQAKETWKAQEHTALTEDETQYLIIEQDLKQTPPESVKDYVAIKQKERAVWLEQSQLRLIGGRP